MLTIDITIFLSQVKTFLTYYPSSETTKQKFSFGKEDDGKP